MVKVDDEKRFKMEFALSSEQQEREGMNDDGAGVSAVLGDLAVLKSALINLYSNKSLQHAWGEEANRRVFEKFNKSTYLKRFHEMNAMYLKNSKYLEFKQL